VVICFVDIVIGTAKISPHIFKEPGADNIDHTPANTRRRALLNQFGKKATIIRHGTLPATCRIATI
jgi:hypothetical protein